MSSLRWYYNRIKAYIGRPRTVIQQKAVVLRDLDRCEHPLFLMGIHRSGTSLLRRMVNSHPQIACPPESFFMANYVAMLDDALCAAGYEGFGYDREAMREDLAHKAGELHEAFRISQGKPIWADKTPQYVAIAEDLDRLFARRPRYLLIYRHPLDIAFSLYARGWRHNDAEDLFEGTLAYIHESMARLNSFYAAHEDRCARFDYHDLCHTPEATLGRALEKIGLAFDPAMLAFANQDHNFGVEDPVIRGKRTIEESAGAWKSWSDERKQRAVELFGPQVLEDRYRHFDDENG